MKKLLVLMVALCLFTGTAVAKDANRHQVMMMQDSQGLFDDISSKGLFGVAQAGTTWIGWSPTGTGPYKLGTPGYWDFDDRGTHACPTENDHDEYIKNGAYAQYWSSEDVYAQKGIYWHAEDYTDPLLACSTNPITGTWSAWCGKIAAAPGECFTDAPGYGHNWNQWLCKTVTLDAATPSLAYNYNGESEAGFDYSYVIIEGSASAECGKGGDNADTLRCYDGAFSGSESIDLTAWDDGNDCDAVAFDADYSGDSVQVCFVVVSDGGWDDQDGGVNTCDGALNVDDIVLDTSHSSGDMVTTTFETGTLEGWTTCGGWSAGDYVAIRDRSSFTNNDECGFDNCDMAGCVLTSFNPNIPGAYGGGGHYAGSFHKRAWSPTIDMTTYFPNDRGYVINSDQYMDLPIPNWIFYRYYVQYVQDVNCPTGAWSPAVSDNYVYYVPVPECRNASWGFSQYVPVDADSVKIGLSSWNGCEVWEVTCTNGNETPIFDNVRLGVWDLSAPLASIRAVDNYTDAFPEADAMAATNTALIDAANNKSQQGYFLRMADSAVIQLDAPDVYAELCFRLEPGPGTNLTDPFFTKYADAGGWNSCELSDDVFCTRMDTALAAGNGIVGDTYETQLVFEGYFASIIHEADPNYVAEGEEIFPDSLFTPGTKIYYAFRTSFLPGPGPYNYLPFGADLATDVSTAFEVMVLPDLCKDPLACLLYVDYYNRGAQAPIEDALTLLGRTWDRFDMRAESSHQANGIGNRLLGPGRYRLARGPIGPSLAHLTQYKAMLVNNGNFSTGVTFSDGGKGTPDDPSNDVTFLDNWISEGPRKGLWMSGNNIANDFATTLIGPKPGFLSSELATTLIDANYRNISGHPISDNCVVIKVRDGEWMIENEYAVQDSFSLVGVGCPQKYEFDVIQDNAGAPGIEFTSGAYWEGGAAFQGASVDHVFKAPNAPFDTVRTRLDGFSVHDLRGNTPECDAAGREVAVALWIRDVLGGNNNDGFFYDKALDVQYCPPQTAEDPTVDVPRGGRTYTNALFQNYPNPFRGGAGTTIHYSVAKPGPVEIRIFDVAGRLVNTIVDQAKLGDNFVVWNGKGSSGRSVASGVYFYQIKNGAFSAHKKMLLVN